MRFSTCTIAFSSFASVAALGELTSGAIAAAATNSAPTAEVAPALSLMKTPCQLIAVAKSTESSRLRRPAFGQDREVHYISQRAQLDRAGGAEG